MSTRFPPHRPVATQVIDADDFNENFEAFIEEIGGNLDEHNFTANGFSVANMADDVFMRVTRVAQDVDWTGARVVPPVFSPAESGAWQAVDNMATTFTSRGGIIWAMASFQYVTAAGAANDRGALFAMRINGQIVPETVIGSSEVGNDRNGTLSSAGLLTGTSGTQRGGQALALDVQLPLPPGVFTIELVMSSVTPNDPPYLKSVLSRELIVIEMTR